MGVEGLDLIRQLIISKTNQSSVQGMLLIDKNTTSCVEVNAYSNTSKSHFAVDWDQLHFAACAESF